MPGQKCTCLDLEAKIAIIRSVDDGRQNSTVAEENGIAPSSLSTILKNHDKLLLLQQWETNASPRGKKIRLSPFNQVEAALFTWFCDIRTVVTVAPSRHSSCFSVLGHDVLAMSYFVTFHRLWTTMLHYNYT